MLHYYEVNIRYDLPVSCLVEEYWDGLNLSNSSFLYHSSLIVVICVPLRQYWHFVELEFVPTLGRNLATKANSSYNPAFRGKMIARFAPLSCRQPSLCNYVL